MSPWKKITRSNFFIRLKSWEYWPFGIVQFPAIMYWLWLSLRARSLVFFSLSNPGIPMGGMFGESKYDVLKRIPREFIPRTLLIEMPATLSEITARIAEEGLALPLIFKPDIGERGYLVRRIQCVCEIAEYLKAIKGNFLIQEMVQLPLEFGVFYMRMPMATEGIVTSVTGKEMLSVTGDGMASLRQLILNKDRAKLQWKKLKASFAGRLDWIVPAGEEVELVSIGNHAMGTRFINENHLINERLSRTFDRISGEVPGFYFGRYDLRCATLKDLYEGNIRIMELNGCGAEPAHIYDPAFSLWEAMKVQVLHWRNIFRIARANRKRGLRYVSHREALDYYRKFKSALK